MPGINIDLLRLCQIYKRKFSKNHCKIYKRKFGKNDCKI